MSISPVGSAGVTQAPDNSARTQLVRETKKLENDAKAEAQAAAEADQAAAEQPTTTTRPGSIDIYM
jgi:hypothetical protein